MRIALFTNEYPPNVYGGAGVHVEYLARELARADGGAHQVDVYPFHDQQADDGNLRVRGTGTPPAIATRDPRHAKLLDALSRDLRMVGLAAGEAGLDIVHCHTWYSHLAGCLARPLTGARLVLTTHSLEPHRPWKVEQLGTAYHASSWIERTAYENADGVVAVSQAMRRDVQDIYGVDANRVRVIHNGIDPEEYRPRHDPAVLAKFGVDPAVPMVLFVGRITRQKGILHLVRALPHLEGDVQVVLCAGAPDTPEILAEMTAAVEAARAHSRARIVWLPEMVSKPEVIALYSQAAVFVCPSVYEPFGIINLEAMACETPVVASSVGGIPEIIVPGVTGELVPFEAVGDETAEPRDPAGFSRALAAAVNALLADPARRERMGRAARERVLAHFSWASIARQTLAFYGELVAGRAGRAGHA